MNEFSPLGGASVVLAARSRSLSRQATAAQWDKEYSRIRSLPSSRSSAPSRCFAQLDDLLSWPEGFSVLDLGSGAGRHCLHFARKGARVHALDISSCAIELSSRLLEQHGMSMKVKFHHASVLDPLPRTTGGFDLILDSYMSCHLLDGDERGRFFVDVHNALAPDGLFVSLGVSPQDAFYAQYAGATFNGCAYVRDPVSEIPKILTTESFIEDELRGLFSVVRSGRMPMSDQMDDREYRKEAVYVAARRATR